MGLFAKLILIVTKSSMLDVGWVLHTPLAIVLPIFVDLEIYEITSNIEIMKKSTNKNLLLKLPLSLSLSFYESDFIKS